MKITRNYLNLIFITFVFIYCIIFYRYYLWLFEKTKEMFTVEFWNILIN